MAPIFVTLNISRIFQLYWLQQIIRLSTGSMMDPTMAKSADKSPHSNDRYYRTVADFSYLREHCYEVVREIGRGGYGVVYKVRIGKKQAVDHINGKKPCAIKINFGTVCREIVFCEIAYLELFEGRKRLPRLKNLVLVEENPHIVLDYFSSEAFITFFDKFSMLEVKHYLMEFLLGLKELKELGIYHRDLKPGNFLYNQSRRRGMVIDFGLAELDPSILTKLEHRIERLKRLVNIPEKKEQLAEEEKKFRKYRRLAYTLNKLGRNKIGTESFMPIESLLHHHEQSYSSDMWPVGVIFLQFVLRKYNVFNSLPIEKPPPDLKNPYFINYLIELSIFFGRTAVIGECARLGYELSLPVDAERCQFREIAVIRGYDDVAEDLLLKMLELNAEKRITVEEAISHPFFEEVRSMHLQDYS